MPAVQKAKKSKKQRKHGRAMRGNQNNRYKAEHRHEKSHMRRIQTHLDRFPTDTTAKEALAFFRKAAGYL